MIVEEKHRILIVDDERINRKLLSELLEQQHEVILAKNGEQALQRVRADPQIDLILLDVMMPGMDGHEVLRQLKAHDAIQHIPVIFITALNSVDDEQTGLDLGAADYISKPFNPAIVTLRVANHLSFVRQRKLLEILAGRDGLTEINNRRRFDETLQKEWQRAKRSARPLSLAIIDVDCFKQFNDHYGHAHGDKVLKSVAKTLSEAPRRPADLAARYGGEEFVLLLPETDAEGARSRAVEVRRAVEALSIPHAYSNAARHVTVSIGGATRIVEEDPPEKLIEAADAMLYQAKSTGRNRVMWEMNRSEAEHALSHAP